MVKKLKASAEGEQPRVKPPQTVRKFHARGTKIIEERLVESETETMIIIGYDTLLKKEIRAKKRSVDEAWCDTWEEAHAFLAAKVEKEVNAARRSLKAWEATQSELLWLKPPAKPE